MEKDILLLQFLSDHIGVAMTYTRLSYALQMVKEAVTGILLAPAIKTMERLLKFTCQLPSKLKPMKKGTLNPGHSKGEPKMS